MHLVFRLNLFQKKYCNTINQHNHNLTSIMEILLTIVGSCVCAFALMIVAEQKVLWIFYGLVAACLIIIFLFASNKFELLKTLFYITIPFNIVKHIGGISLTKLAVKPTGLKSLIYFSVNEIMLLFLVAALLFKQVNTRQILNIEKQDLIFIGYFVILLLSFTFNFENWMYGINEIRRYFVLLAVFYVISRIFSHDKDNNYFLFTILATLIIEFIVGIGQFWGKYYEIFSIFGARTESVGFYTSKINRIYGTFSHPNTFSSYLILVVPIALSGIFIDNKKLRLGAIVASLCGTILIFLSYSRGAWLAFLVQLVLFAFMGRNILPSWVYNKRLWLAIALLLVIVIGTNFEAISFRLASRESADAAYTRISQAKVAIYYLKNNPIWGIGSGNYIAELPFVDRLLNVRSYGLVVHNIYLKQLAELGIIGLSFYLLMYITSLNRIRSSLIGGDKCSIMLLGVFAALCGHLIHNMFDIAEVQDNISTMLFLLFGIVMAQKQSPMRRCEINQGIAI